MKGETEALRVAMNEIKTEFCGIDPAGADEEEKEDIIQVCLPLFKIHLGRIYSFLNKAKIFDWIKVNSSILKSDHN